MAAAVQLRTLPGQQLLRPGLLAERCFPEDRNASLLKLRQLAELLAQQVAARVGIYTSAEELQFELIRRLQDQGIPTFRYQSSTELSFSQAFARS